MCLWHLQSPDPDALRTQQKWFLTQPSGVTGNSFGLAQWDCIVCLICSCFVFYNLLWRLDFMLYFTLKFYNSRWLKALKIWFWQLCKLPACSSLFLSRLIQVILLTVTSRALSSKASPISLKPPLPSAEVIIVRAPTDWWLTMGQALSVVLYMDCLSFLKKPWETEII